MLKIGQIKKISQRYILSYKLRNRQITLELKWIIYVGRVNKFSPNEWILQPIKTLPEANFEIVSQ